eukprot:g3366.t1
MLLLTCLVLLTLVCESFGALSTSNNFIKFDVPSAERQMALAEVGKRKLAEISEGGETGKSCFKEIVKEDLKGDCGSLRTDQEMKGHVALKFTRCYLKLNRRSIHEACLADATKEVDVSSCTSQLTGHDFTIYTMFYTHIDNICFYLYSEIWQESVSETTNTLVQRAADVNSKLQYMDNTIGTKLDVIRTLSLTLFGEIFPLQSFLFYTMTLIAIVAVSSTNYSKSSRLPMIMLLFLTLMLERGVTFLGQKGLEYSAALAAQDSDSLTYFGWFALSVFGAPSTETFNPQLFIGENVRKIIWIFRYFFIAASFTAVILAIGFHRNYVKENNLLLSRLVTHHETLLNSEDDDGSNVNPDNEPTNTASHSSSSSTVAVFQWTLGLIFGNKSLRRDEEYIPEEDEDIDEEEDSEDEMGNIGAGSTTQFTDCQNLISQAQNDAKILLVPSQGWGENPSPNDENDSSAMNKQTSSNNGPRRSKRLSRRRSASPSPSPSASKKTKVTLKTSSPLPPPSSPLPQSSSMVKRLYHEILRPRSKWAISYTESTLASIKDRLNPIVLTEAPRDFARVVRLNLLESIAQNQEQDGSGSILGGEYGEREAI